jgi:hypothetical protein
VRRLVNADERATATTPTIRAAIPPASMASMPGETWTRSPNTTMPSTIPASGSPAAMVGSEARSGAALNALCISQTPVMPAPTSAYADQVLNSTVHEWPCSASSVCLVSASWMPKTRPAPRPVKVARTCPFARRPRLTAMNAMAAMIAAAGQCETEPNDKPIGLVVRVEDSSATPVHKISAPAISGSRNTCFDIGTASTSANSRLVLSSGSTRVSSRCPIAQAASNMPAIMQMMPASHLGLRSRSVRIRGDRNRESGSCSAVYCWRTKPTPSSNAASSAVA